jgi:Protein of unknown function (DUF998)
VAHLERSAKRKMIFDQSRQAFVATLAASIGVVIWSLGISVAIVSYNHSNATPFSCWNHFASELGFLGASRRAWVFNATEAFGSLMSLSIIYSLGARLHSRLGYLASCFGLLTFLTASGIGALGLSPRYLFANHVTSEFLQAHNVTAIVFFIGWLLTVTLFTRALGGRWQNRASRPLVVTGATGFLVCLSFVACGAYALQHPRVTWPAIMEWVLLGSVFLWHGFIVVFLLSKDDGREDLKKEPNQTLEPTAPSGPGSP